MFQLPEQVHSALRQLEAAGYEAYIVGGCVRDFLMGRIPTDYDITTSALPAETEKVFSEYRVIETGLKHGTVTVLLDGTPLEITTYRVDGSYSDGRHPDQVSFSRSLTDDLSRRDFTMNAIAYSVSSGIVDPFGGQTDILRRSIRCVGSPETRFHEDALRILRAIRFASVLDFQIDSATAEALHCEAPFLKNVSAERIYSEFRKLLCGTAVRRVLLEYTDVLGVFLPEVLPMRGFSQHNSHHVYDILEHTAVTVENIAPVPELRLAAFLHDIGKPCCFSMDDFGVGHFYNHAQRSAELAATILERLRADRDSSDRIITLVRQHGMQIEPEERYVKRALQKLTPGIFFDLLLLKRADNLAQAPENRERQNLYNQLETIAKNILEQNECLSRASLAVNGKDLLELGLRGPEIGEALQQMLDAVIDGTVQNERDSLLAYFRQLQ